MAERVAKRMAVELRQLQRDPPPGVSAWPMDGRIDKLEAVIQGPAGTVYEGGSFKLSIAIPDRYPVEPPKLQFITRIYHPNIDSSGRICLDILNMPPKGAYKPSLNLCTVLHSIEQLMRYPNPDDGLMVDITNQYRNNRAAFDAVARRWTAQHAGEQQLDGQQGQVQPGGEASIVAGVGEAATAVGGRAEADLQPGSGIGEYGGQAATAAVESGGAVLQPSRADGGNEGHGEQTRGAGGVDAAAGCTYAPSADAPMAAGSAGGLAAAADAQQAGGAAGEEPLASVAVHAANAAPAPPRSKRFKLR